MSSAFLQSEQKRCKEVGKSYLSPTTTCSGGRIHPSEDKQNIYSQEDPEKKYLDLLQRCLGVFLGHILFLSYGLICALGLYIAVYQEKMSVYIWSLLQGPDSWGYENMSIHNPVTHQSIAQGCTRASGRQFSALSYHVTLSCLLGTIVKTVYLYQIWSSI